MALMKFEVEGPLELPFTRGKAGRSIRSDDGREFWRQHPEMASRRGCYLFCMRAGQGLTVAYVGQATVSFEQEAFQPHKLVKYHEVLMGYARGTPLMYFLTAPTQRGPINRTAIDECEDWLIWAAKRANPHVMNDKGGAAAPFEIPHVSDPARGRPSRAALDLCNALDIPSPSMLKKAKRAYTQSLVEDAFFSEESSVSAPVPDLVIS